MTPRNAAPAPQQSAALRWLARAGSWARGVLRSPIVAALPGHKSITPQRDAVSLYPVPRPRPAGLSRTWTDPELAQRTADFPVLCADDDHEMLQLYTLGLHYAGVTVVTVTNGLSALRLCRAIPASLLLTDITMPTMDGLTAVEHLRAAPDTARIPVIFLSTLSDQSTRNRARALGAFDYITLPVGPEQLLTAVQAALQQHGNWQRPAQFDPALWETVRASMPRWEW